MSKYSHITDLVGLLEARAHSGYSAFEMCALHEAKLIAILRHLGLPRFDAELQLHDALREHERRLFAALRNQIHLDDATHAVHQIFGGGE